MKPYTNKVRNFSKYPTHCRVCEKSTTNNFDPS